MSDSLKKIAENTNVKLAEVDKFESFGEFVCKNLSLLKEELLANINDTTSLNELGGKISNMLNAISSELVEKIDKIGSLDEARSQILLLLTQFTSEMEQKIASIDQADTVKNEISSSISSLLAQVEEKISKMLSCNVMLVNQIDPSLVGGFKVQVEDYILDDSMKHRLEKLKENITLKKGEND